MGKKKSQYNMISNYLKWLGAKTKVLNDLMDHMPASKVRYFVEPFCGSAIVYVNMKYKRLVEKGILNDIGKWVMLSHKLVRDNLNYYLEEGKKYKQRVNEVLNDENKFKSLYLSIRDRFNIGVDNGEETNAQIMRFVFLSKMGYNGLVRFTNKGYSSTSPGSHDKNFSYSEIDMKKFSVSLQDAKFSILSYDVFLDKLKDHLTDKDMVFYDPPYPPTSFNENEKGKSFGSYFGNDFNFYDIEKIKSYFDFFNKKKVKQMITLSDLPIIRDLFKNYNIRSNTVLKLAKGKKGTAANTKELIITNY